MATLNLTTEEFEDIVLIFLFDMVMNAELIKNKNFSSFIEMNSSKIRTPLTKYYLDSDSETRLRYKRIKGIFNGSDESTQQIRINSSNKKETEDNKKENKSIVKKIIKKLIKKEDLNIEDLKVLNEIYNEEEL